VFIKRPKNNLDASSHAVICRARHTGKPGRQRGVAALELAILTPLLLLMLFAIIDWGYVYYVDLTMTNGVREGARVGVTRATIASAEDDARQTAVQYISTVGTHNTIVISATMNNDGQLSVVATISDFQPLIGFLPETALPSRLTTQAAMRWELAGQ